MELNDLLERSTEEIVSMLSDHGVGVHVADDVQLGRVVQIPGMGEAILDDVELCILLWGVIAGKRRAASME
jgi:hypothetical protein